MPLRKPNSTPDVDVPVVSGRITGRASTAAGDRLQSLLRQLLTPTTSTNTSTHNRNNNRSNYNSKRMFHSDTTNSQSSRSNATTKALAIGILRALWDDYSQNNSHSSTKYVPIALTAPSSPSTAKAIVIEKTKNKILPYPPSNLITIHNFHPSVDELRPSQKVPTQHLFNPSDYDNWDEIKNPEENDGGSMGQSEEIMSQLPISIKRTPMVTSTVTVRPQKVQPLRVQVITSSGQTLDNGGGHDSHVGMEDSNGVNEDGQQHTKPKTKKNKTRKKTIKNKSKKTAVTSTTTSTASSMIVVAEEEYGQQEADDDPVDPDLETQLTYVDEESDIKQTNDGEGQEEETEDGQDHQPYLGDVEEDQVKEVEEDVADRDHHQSETFNQDNCPRGNKFSADRDDNRCVRRPSTKKRPKQKFHDDILEDFLGADSETETDDPLLRHGVKVKPPKVPKIKVPKIKVPKIKVPKVKPPKVKLSLKDMPTMMAMMKTFFTGVSVATMYNPFNFGLWSVVLHPVTMLLIGLGGVFMYCFPWTSVAMLTSRQNSGNTIEVHRFGRRIGSRPGSRTVRVVNPSTRSDWLEDHAAWILGVINNYTFQTDL